MEAWSKRGGDLCPFTRIEKRLDNATLDVSSHQERKDFKHTQIQGMPDFLLHENKKENVEEQLIEPYEEKEEGKVPLLNVWQERKKERSIPSQYLKVRSWSSYDFCIISKKIVLLGMFSPQ